MDSHERAVLSDVLKTLHALVGRSDAQADLRPILQFVPERVQEKKSPEPFFGSGEEGVFEIQFTNKEIEKMPKSFKKEFRIEGCTTRLRKRTRGKSGCSYELRYRRNGYNVSVSARTIDDVKKKFVEKLHRIESGDVFAHVPTDMHGFTMYYFENFRKRKIVPKTYEADLGRYRLHIQPTFGNMPLKSVTPIICQKVLDRLDEQGKGKTREEIFSLLNQTFKMAVRHGIIKQNPLDVVITFKHERKHGTALTVDEERKLLAETAGTPFQKMFAVALWTGLRPFEYKTARLEDGVIIAQNCKRKNAARGKIEWKRIPVCPMLRPYLAGDSNGPIAFYVPETMRDKFNKILTGHTLKDLRTTFYTRCKTCGVDMPALNEFVGHSNGVLGDTYTDLPMDYLAAQAEKIRY